MYTVFAFTEGSMSKGELQKELEDIESKVAVLKGGMEQIKTYEISLFLYNETKANIDLQNLKFLLKKKGFEDLYEEKHISTRAWKIANKMEKYGNQAAEFYIVVLDWETILNSKYKSSQLFRYSSILTDLNDITASLKKMVDNVIYHSEPYEVKEFYRDLKKSVEDYKARVIAKIGKIGSRS